MNRFDRERAAVTEPSPFVPMGLSHRLLAIALLWAYLAVVLGLALVTPTGASGRVVLALGLYIGLLMLPFVVYRSTWGWFHPLIITVFFSCLELLRKLGTYAYGIGSHSALPNYGPGELMDLLAYSLLVMSGALVAYYTGFFTFPVPRPPRLSFPRMHVSRTRLRVLAAVAFSALAFLLYMNMKGGLAAHIASWSQTRRVALAGEQFWPPLIWVGALACTFWIAVYPKVHRSPVFWICSAVAFPLVFLVNGSRGALVWIMMVGMVVWMLRHRKIVYFRAALAGFVAFMLLGALGALRFTVYTGQLDWSALLKPVGGTVAAAGAELEQRSSNIATLYAVLGRVPDNDPLQYGKTYLAVLSVPVPRAVWPDKPWLADALAGKVFFGVPWGMPAGAIGEAYWNLHVPGVILVFLLFGGFHRWLAATYRNYAGEPAAVFLYATTLVIFQSPSSAGVVKLMLTLVPVLIMLILFGAIRLPAVRRERWTPRNRLAQASR